MNDNMPMVAVNDLDVTFDTGKHQVHALAGVSFSIAPGESFGLVGESGSGKTTVGRTILRLYEPAEGAVVFEGQDITKNGEQPAQGNPPAGQPQNQPQGQSPPTPAPHK